MHQRLLASVYLDAKELVLRAGYANEVAWQSSRPWPKIGASDFLREAAWVILSAGLSERAVRSVFPRISNAYCHWDVNTLVAGDIVRCRAQAIQVFSHPGKVDAITAVCLDVYHSGVESVVEALRTEGPSYLATFDFIGPVTSLHLAKNLGLQVAKPDRHLVRIADRLGCPDVQEMCRSIAAFTGDSVAVVDLVLWRFAESHRTYLHLIDKSVEQWF